jgi:hypothetical protein
MSKDIRKFRKNDYYDDNDGYNSRSNKADKKKLRRIQRAIKTKNVDYLMSDENTERMIADIRFHK